MPILLGITIAFVLAIIVLLIIFLPGLFSATGENTTTPKFIGMKYEDIINNPDYDADFNFKEQWGHNSEYAIGYVYGQSIKEGAKIKDDANTEITLYISRGPKTVVVNDVYKMTEVRAINELEANKFKVVVTPMASEDVEKGFVIRTEPAKNAKVSEGSTVTIYVSTGKPTEYVNIPDITSEPLEQAKEKLTENKLLVVVEEVDIAWNEKYQPKDYVVRQSPEATGTKIAEGSTITVYVSTGRYVADLKINLPADLDGESICTVSLWQDGKEIMTSSNLDLTQVESYTFEKVVSKDRVAEYTVKLKGETSGSKDYKTIRVNYRASSESDLITVLSN